MPDKKRIFFPLLIISLISACSLPSESNKSVENTLLIGNQSKDINKQGPASTGGLFRINYKNGTAAALSNFKIQAQSNNITSEVGLGKTNESGEALLPETVITPELINLIKDNKIKLVIKVIINDKEFTAEIKNLDFKTDKLISVTAEVDAPVPVEISLSQKTVNISKMQSTSLYAEVLMSDGSKNSNVNWASSDETVATVNNGKISGLKKGVTIITVSAVSGLNIQNKITVSVDDNQQVNSVKIIDPVNKTIIEKITLKTSESKQLAAQSLISDGSVSGNIIWKSSDESKVAVGQNSGLVTGISKGLATVTATSTMDLNKYATIEVLIEE